MKELSQDSLEKLSTCHVDLQRLFMEVAKNEPCKVLCGHRSSDEQAEMFKSGLSEKRFPLSRHNSFPSLAVDVIPYNSQATNPSREMLNYFGGYVKGTADQLGIKILWGPTMMYYDELDDWGPYCHFELNYQEDII